MIRWARRVGWLGVLLLAGAGGSAAVRGATGFIGVEGCAVCHPKQVEAWKQSPHARAFDVLTESQRADPRCQFCHSTRASEGLASVQCESCHGSGIHYARETIMRDVELARAVGLRTGDLKDCAECHDAAAPNVRSFNAEEAWKRLPHSRTKNAAP